MTRKYILPFMFILIALSLFAEKPYLLVVSFDAFRYDYMEKTETPNLDYLRDNGVKAASMQSVFPSKTFPNHYAIATGAYAGTNGLVGNSFYSQEFNEYYSLGDTSAVRDGKWYGSEPIWVTAERQDVATASFFWVGSEAAIKGIRPSLYKKYDHGFPYESRIDTVMAWFQLPEEKRPHLIMLYFDQPDSDGHKFGPDSQEIIERISYMDSILGEILAGIESLPIADEVNLILLSDHGMTNVGENHVINISQHIKDPENLRKYSRGPVTQLNLKDYNEEEVENIANNLDALEHLDAYKYEDIPEKYHFKHRNAGDILLVADEGWIISGDDREYRSVATHGYDPALQNMQGIFYAKGPVFKSNYQIKTFENINIYPLICKIFEINPYENATDRPDGRLEVLEEILK